MWTRYTDDRGSSWELDQLGLWILVRQHVYNMALRRRSHIQRVTHWFGPDEVSVETDFSGINRERDERSYPLYQRLELEAIQDGGRTLDRLIEMRQQTEQAVHAVRRMHGRASHEMFENIDQSVHRGEIAVSAASGIRDLSATVLVVGSAMMTGGAAVAVLGGGSFLKGVASYEDNGNVGAAVLTATGTFVVGAFALPGGTLPANASLSTMIGGESVVASEAMSAATSGQQATLVVVGAAVDAQLEASNALLQGRSGADALRAAAAKFGVDVISAGIGSGLGSVSLPVVVRLATDTTVSSAGDMSMSAMTSGGQAGSRPRSPSGRVLPRLPRHAARSLPVPTNPPVCDANATVGDRQCSARDWVSQIVLRRA